MTGITDNEYAVSALMAKVLAAGVPAESFGYGGKRTVGPCVTLRVGGYYANSDTGHFLGKTRADAMATIRLAYRSWIDAGAVEVAQ